MSSYHYWQHFLTLEADFVATARYVEFSKNNFSTYSIEYAKLLLAIGSEVDVLCKIICENIDNIAKRKVIDDYRNCLTAHTHITSEKVLIRRYNLAFEPWNAWAGGNNNPKWWKSYNNVKHQRNTYFSEASPEASLGNCANAISGLFVAVLYCHKAEHSIGKLEPFPILLGREHEPDILITSGGYVVPEFF